MRTESVPGIASSGEPDGGGPRAFEFEKYEDRAYPLTSIPIALSKKAQGDSDNVDNESDNGHRGARLKSSWISIGPTRAEYPAILNRTGTPYVASGRISA